MKKLLLLAIASTFSIGAWATDTEKNEYCKHKYEQVTMDVAYKGAGCNFSKETQEHIDRNLQNTYLNCAEHLSENDRLQIGQQSLALTNVMIKKLGKEQACASNASLYPQQIYN